MAAPNEPTPDSSQPDNPPATETEGNGAPSAGFTPNLPEVNPITVDAADEPESDAAPAAEADKPEAVTVTFEDIAPGAATPTEATSDVASKAPEDSGQGDVVEATAPEDAPLGGAAGTPTDAAAVGSSAVEAPEALAPAEAALAEEEPAGEALSGAPQAAETAPAEARSDGDRPEPATAPPVTPSPAAPSAATPPATTPQPTASAGTIQRIWGLLKPALKAGLATGIKGANWLTQRLEAVPPPVDSSATGGSGAIAGVWKVIKPLLVALTLLLSRLFNQVLQWSLARLDPEAKAAAAAESSRVAFLITSATLAVLVFLVGNTLTSAPAPAAQPAITAPSKAQPSSPTQALLETLQGRIADITAEYDGAVAAADLDLSGDRLAVTLDDGWYSLPATQQKQLARDLQQRAADSRLPQLTLLNQRGERIARTPVVGEGLIFFQTTAPPPPPPVPDELVSPAEPPAADLDRIDPSLAEVNTADSASPAAAAPGPSSPAALEPLE